MAQLVGNSEPLADATFACVHDNRREDVIGDKDARDIIKRPGKKFYPDSGA